MKTKICKICGQEKPLSEFYTRKKDENGNPISYSTECKQCHCDREKGRYQLKKEFINSFKDECKKCGDIRTWVLDFHHKDPSEKDFTVAALKKTNKDVIKQEIDKCIVLCANCHREFHYLNSYYNINLDQYLNNDYDLSKMDIQLKNQAQKERCLNGILNKNNKDNNCDKEKQQKYCIDCGKPISSEAIRCKECYNKHRQFCERPSREELKDLIRNNTMVSIGKKFGVSDNAIRKWCKAVNLPTRKKEIDNYSNEEWNNI